LVKVSWKEEEGIIWIVGCFDYEMKEEET